jgi:catechol 2,3-dioxygenase-like lactoylglutathione lyase family enzyme
MVGGVEHLALCANDPPALAAWYQKLFALEVVREGDTGPLFLRFADGFLLEVLKAGATAAQPPGAREAGYRHIALSVRPIEPLVDILEREGVVVVEEYRIVPGGTKLFLFRDLEGNLVQLVERPRPLGGDRAERDR